MDGVAKRLKRRGIGDIVCGCTVWGGEWGDKIEGDGDGSCALGMSVGEVGRGDAPRGVARACVVVEMDGVRVFWAVGGWWREAGVLRRAVVTQAWRGLVSGVWGGNQKRWSVAAPVSSAWVRVGAAAQARRWAAEKRRSRKRFHRAKLTLGGRGGGWRGS